jgi:hypothetical protein
MAKKRRSKDDLKEIDVLVERLREFVRLNYMTAAEVADRSALMILPCTHGFWVKQDRQNLSASPHFWIRCREKTDPAWLQRDINIANTRTGAGYPSRAVAPSVSRRKERFDENAAGFWESVQTATHQDRSERATIMRCRRGTGTQ